MMQNPNIETGIRSVSPTIGNRLQRRQKLVAAVMFWGPVIGTLLALFLAHTDGVGAIEITLLLAMYILTNLGVDFCFHRELSHRSYKTKRLITITFAIFGSMAAEGSVQYWVATHRRHHIYSDTEHDPHSPHVRNIGDHKERLSIWRGLWHSHVGWTMCDKGTNCTLFAKDILRDSTLRKINELYIPIVIAGLLIPAAIGGVLHGTWNGFLNGLLWGGFVRIFLVHNFTFVNASFAHLWGYRPFATGDRSANNVWCAIPSLGASYQNNHHAFPTSAHFGLRWWEIDIGAWPVRLLKPLGLIWDVKRPTAKEMQEKKAGTAETASADH